MSRHNYDDREFRSYDRDRRERFDRDEVRACDEHHNHERPNPLHTHEFLDSVKIAEREDDPHNHRFAGVTGKAILVDGNHYHLLEENTDIYEDHTHVVKDRTGLAIFVGDERHVHFVHGKTTFNDGHQHEFEFATLIDDPIGD